jgi:hypothetical protein
MRSRSARLHPTDVQGSGPEVDLIPQVHQFGGPQAVPIGRKDHGGVAAAVPIALGCRHQALDFGLGEVHAGAQVAIGTPLRG